MSDDRYRDIFVQNLRYFMAINGKSQKDLATDLGYSTAIISNWCTGKKLPRIAKVQQLADYFGVEKSDLLEEKVVVSDTDPQLDELCRLCATLTADGIQRVIEYADDLTHNPKYRKSKFGIGK